MLTTRNSYRIHPRLLWMLHDRGLTVQGMAEKIGSSRSHVQETLANKPNHGHLTRKKLAPLLTSEERRILGWNDAGRPVFHVESSNSIEIRNR